MGLSPDHGAEVLALPPQDTVIALDALSAYWIAAHTVEEKELNVTLSSVGRSGFMSYDLQLNNHQVQGLEEELQVNTPIPGLPLWLL